MRFFTILAAVGAVSAATIQRRTEVDDFINVITQPSTGTVIQPGDSFAFHYLPSSRCELLYTGVRIWLLSKQPTLADFDSGGGLKDSSSSLNYYGEFVTINLSDFPNYTGSPTIPNNLTMPTLDQSLLGSNIYLTATQSENGECASYYPTGFDASFVEIQYGSV